MKKLLSLRTLRLVLLFSLTTTFAQAAEYYVVIGSFADESNARRFVSEVRHAFEEVSYSYNAMRELYYVHVMKTYRKEEAHNWTVYLKKQKGFPDAWVFAYEVPNGMPGEAPTDGSGRRTARFERSDETLLHCGLFAEANVPATTSSAPVIVSAAGGEKYLSYNHRQVTAEIPKAGSELTPESTRPGTITAPAVLSWTSSAGVSYIHGLENAPAMVDRQLTSGADVFTFVVEDSDGREIPSEVMLVDFEKLKVITSFKTGEHAAIRGTRKEQMVTLVCEQLGYAQETRVYNIDHLSRGRDIIKKDNGVWEVRFRLRKMEVNDVAFLHGTAFYKDAAILRKDSEAELERLVAVMQDNPEYKITIHSYCNPEQKRVAILPGKAGSFFDMSGSVSKTVSDRRLTKERARTIKNYLVAKGISKKRVGTIGWGSIERSLVGDGKERGIEVELVED